MVALHPPLSGFPLSFLSLLVAIEALQFTRFERYTQNCKGVVIIATLLSTGASFLSGYQAVGELGEVSEITEQLISQHHVLGKLLVLNIVALAASHWIGAVARHGKLFFKVAYYVLLSTQVALTLWAGYLGGALVFSHGVGVRA